ILSRGVPPSDMGAADPHVIVVGAGAAGLAAARELVQAEVPTLVLEARSRLFGRVDTRHDAAWAVPVELGAESVPDEAPLTTSLAARYSIGLETVPEIRRRTEHGEPAPFRVP